jgi:hypothetical protein
MQFRFIFDDIPNTFFWKNYEGKHQKQKPLITERKGTDKIPVVMNKKLPH